MNRRLAGPCSVTTMVSDETAKTGRAWVLPAMCLVLLGLGLPATGVLDLPWLPAAPWTLAPFVALAVAFVALGVASQRSHPLARVVGVAAVSAPFLVLAIRGAPPGPHGASVPFVAPLLVVIALVVAALPQRWRGLSAAGALAYALLAHGLGPVGISLLPERWLATAGIERGPEIDRSMLPEAYRGPVRDRATRARTPLGLGEGPWWVRAETGPEATQRPLVAAWTATKPAEARTARWSWLDAGDLDALHVLDLEPADVVWIGEGAWPAGSRDTPLRVQAIAEFVRGGGTAVVVVPDGASLPDGLAGVLPKAAAPSAEQLFGLGRVVVFPTPKEAVDAILGRHLWVAPIGTRLDGQPSIPRLPAALAPWKDEPGGRRPAAAVLGLFLLATLGFTWAARDPRAATLLVALAAAGASVAVAWVLPTVPGVRLHGVRIDLGGVGGRRVEAVAIAAGPTGFRGPVRWGGDGYVRFVGGLEQPGGEVELAPGGLAWAVRTTRVGLPDPADQEDRAGGWLLGLLAGEVDPARARLGSGIALDVTVGGEAPPPASTVAYRSR